jgi:NTP pyrophosphatase (non-canonical NTP hydrolase)
MEGLNKFAQDIYKANKAKGFWDKERNVGEMLMLIVSELGEAMEAHRKGRNCEYQIEQTTWDINPTFAKDLFENYQKDTFEDEIADTMIRLLDMCGGLGIDIEAHIYNKLQYNKTRERLHGKNY